MTAEFDGYISLFLIEWYLHILSYEIQKLLILNKIKTTLVKMINQQMHFAHIPQQLKYEIRKNEFPSKNISKIFF